MSFSGGRFQILALGLAAVTAVTAFESGVQAQQKDPVCNVFISEEANKIVFSETDLNDFNIMVRLKREKKTGLLSYFSTSDILEIGSNRVSVPYSTVSPTDFLVQVTESIIPTVAPAGPGAPATRKILWKTVIWSGTRPGATPKLVQKAVWSTEIDADQYSKSETYRRRVAYSWLSAFPACR